MNRRWSGVAEHGGPDTRVRKDRPVPEEQCWDAAFKKEADEFIYQMGQYFDSTKSVS